MSNTNVTNIKNLPEVDQIVDGDYLIVENTSGTNKLNFENFVVGTNNISFLTNLVSYFSKETGYFSPTTGSTYFTNNPGLKIDSYSFSTGSGNSYISLKFNEVNYTDINEFDIKIVNKVRPILFGQSITNNENNTCTVSITGVGTLNSSDLVNIKLERLRKLT